MATFVRLRDIRLVLGDRFPEDLMSTEGQQVLTNLLNEEGVINALGQKGYTREDVRYFLQTLSAEHLLFQQWITSNNVLDDFLAEGILGTYHDNQGVLSHRLYKEFQFYVSSFLADRMLALTSSADQIIRNELCSFLPLLDDDNRYLVEDQLFRHFKKQLKSIEDNWSNWDTEDQQKSEVMPLLADEVLNELNRYSKASYANIMYFVDTILNTIHAPGCTPRFANWMIKRLELLDLNNEHQEKIRQFKQDLAEGKIKVHNTAHAKSKGGQRVLPLVILFGLIGLIFWIVYFKPFNGKDEVNDHKNSSFTELTVDERKEIDSIVQTMNQNIDLGEEQLDPGIFSGGGSVLTLRKAFQNKLMEQIYSDLSKDGRLTYLYPNDSCGKSENFVAYFGTRSIKEQKQGTECILRNESEYDLTIFVADNKPGGKIYTAYIKQGKMLEFKMERGMVLTCVAGNTYRKFEIPNGAAQDDLPSPGYTYHFCERDQNFEETINRSYVMKNASGKAKFVLAGKKSQIVQLIDLMHATDPY